MRTLFFTHKLLYALIAILLLLCAACSESEPVKLGFIGNTTGEGQDLGIGGRDGVILAIEEVNETGGIAGRPVFMVPRNSQNQPETAQAILEYMVEKRVQGVVGPMTNRMSMAAVQKLQEFGVVLISPTANIEELQTRDDRFFSIYPAVKDIAFKLATLAVETRKYKRISVIYDLSNREYTEPFQDHFSEAIARLGGQVVQRISYTTRDDTEYQLLTRQAIENNPDALLILAGPRDTAMLCRQLRIRTERIGILVSEWSTSDQTIYHGGSAVEGIDFFQSYDKSDRSVDYHLFRQRFLARFHYEPSVASMHAYEAAQILLLMFPQVKNADQLQRKIIERSEFEGLQTKIVFDEFGDPQRPLVLKTIKNGMTITAGY